MAEDTNEDQIRQQKERDAREANDRRIAERLDRLNAIANQADERKAQDGMEDLDDEAWSDRAPKSRPTKDEEEDPADTIADAEKADRELDEARAAGADDVRVTNGETYYRVIVNGNEKWLTLQQLRETSSKVSAADEYLRAAKEAAKTAITGLNPSNQTDDSVSAAPGRVRELLNRALMGEQEAIDELARRLEGPSVTTDVLKAVDERVDGRLTFRQAVDWFDREYSAELSNPKLKSLMVQRDAQLAAEHPDMDFKQRLKMVGDEIRDLRRELGGIAPKTPERTEKEARKASVRTIQPAAGRLVDDSDEDEDDTYESSIRKMAAARGQARPVVHKR